MTVSKKIVPSLLVMFLCAPAVAQETVGRAAGGEDGQILFNNACRTCHTLREGDNRLGPNLNKVVGRKAGSLANYGYSSALKGADITWDKANLDKFIANPDQIVSGHAMRPYGGIASPEERQKIIAFLEAQ